MTTPFTYEFGYSWWIGWGYLVPIALFGALAVLALRLKWRRWVVIASSVLAAWAVAGLLMTHFLFGLNFPVELPTEQFLSSGADASSISARAPAGHPLGCCWQDPA